MASVHQMRPLLSYDLVVVLLYALKLDRKAPRKYAFEYTWLDCIRQFVDNLAPV